MFNGGDKALDYIPSRLEDVIREGAFEDHNNLMLNADMAIQPQPSGATNYPPLGWQLGSPVSGGFICQADAANGLFSGNGTLLKLYNTDEIFSDCFAPDAASVTQYQYDYIYKDTAKPIVLQVWIKAHATAGSDPVVIGIRDSVNVFESADIYPTGVWTSYFVYASSISDLSTGIQVYIRNTAGSANFCQFYVGGVQVHTGQTPIAWRPGNNHQEHDFTLVAGGALSAPSYPRIGALITSATAGVPVMGRVIGASWDIFEDTAPTVSDVDKWQLSISDETGAEALPALAVYDLPITEHAVSGCYTIPNANRPIIIAGEGQGARITQKITAVAGTPGQNGICNMKVYTLK